MQEQELGIKASEAEISGGGQQQPNHWLEREQHEG